MLAARPQKFTFGEMREMAVRGVLIYCADYRCSHSVALSADRWPDDIRLSDIEPRFVCAPAASAVRTSGRTSIGKAARSGRWGIGEVLREGSKRETASS
jgi:hypothetical protein